MPRSTFSILLSIVLAGVTLGFSALAGDRNLPEHNVVSPATPALQPALGTHQSYSEIESASSLANPGGNPPVEAVSSAPPTRSSFFATWQTIAGASSYLLDVSTSSSFSSFVEGYHDLDVGNVTGRVVTGLNAGTTYYYRIRNGAARAGSYSEVMTAATMAPAGLIIHATFDSSITNSPNAAAIQATINRAIAFYESLFSDPITIQIRFRYATTAPDGTALPHMTAAQSWFVIYPLPWSTFVNALRADARTSNDNVANASLPGNALSANIAPGSADGRAVGLDTPPAMLANGDVGPGGPYDGIVTLNSSAPYQFTRPTSGNTLDAQRSVEHEMDELIGLGSHLNSNDSNLRPQDLFSWSSPGVRNVTTSGTRYFSINGGVTNIVNFNQNSDQDLGDWISPSCPQPHPYVQNAIACFGQSSDISVTSPEGINLDVIGYDLQASPIAVPYDFNNDAHSDFLLSNGATRQTAIWYLNNNVLKGAAFGPTLPGVWQVVGVADFNRDGHPDYLLFNSVSHATVIWYMNNNVHVSSTTGPTLPSGWSVSALADINLDGYSDYVLFNVNTGGTVVWYMHNNTHIGSGAGPAVPGGWALAGVADFNGDNRPDYLLFNAATRATVIWYMSGVAHVGSHAGPTVTAGYAVVGLSDFDRNGRPDYVLYNSGTRQTAIWYLNNYQLIGGASGPTVPSGWTLVAP
ncbi:MAG TPA: VCBS repeat-containing protein [Candidatus Udaeobacter sp.]|nr:VCBS repeat-containing protein [Candidatus Udaeobacter sp.]